MELPVAPYRMRAGIVTLGVLTVCACGSQQAELHLPQCGPREGVLSTDVRAEDLVGEYDLLLIARTGEETGSRVAGELVLQPYVTARDAAVPFRLTGTAVIGLEQVGAVRLGDLMSRDTVAPGVAVLERRVGAAGGEVSEITLRLGSLANQRNNTRFDGAYTALRVTWVDKAGFGGTWASGVAGPESAGYFCAFRKGGEE
ncbi:MAG: hypothetical protein AMS18_13375 [Gemmatimonas sp. SG8_17]|nr:MAG: hypothetical protein AMS18_13375 [Gemmatimonas sp. SG8_17]